MIHKNLAKTTSEIQVESPNHDNQILNKESQNDEYLNLL